MQDGVEQSDELLLVAFFAEAFEEGKVVEDREAFFGYGHGESIAWIGGKR
jgi:hypothetical protein